MDFLHDPTFLVLAAIGVGIIGYILATSKQREVANALADADIAKANAQVAAAQTSIVQSQYDQLVLKQWMRMVSKSGLPTDLQRKLTEARELGSLQGEALVFELRTRLTYELKRARGEARIQLQALLHELNATFEAGKRYDVYKDARNASKASGFEEPISGNDGPELRDDDETSRASGANRKGNSRHSKPRRPRDEDSGV